MGHITTTLTVTNAADEIRAADGTIEMSAVRRVILNDVLVDTGATTLCLPQSVIEELGLQPAREITVSTAGLDMRMIYEQVRITVENRSGIFECIALPDEAEPLLGVIPLEGLGLEPDLIRQRLRILPEHGRLTYVRA